MSEDDSGKLCCRYLSPIDEIHYSSASLYAGT
jgi:hypothetical protein